MMILAFFIFAIGLISVYLIGIYRFEKKSKIHIENKKLNNQEITVIIPLRNESDNLHKLIQSIDSLTIKPLEIIFINDHSQDSSLEILSKHTFNSTTRILSLDSAYHGKKDALRFGIQHAKGKYILSWDADIEVNPDFFKTIKTLPKKDLYILPVRMKAEKKRYEFMELDFHYINALNVATFGFNKPIIANGANMLFNREKFLLSDSIQHHKNILGGDDVFILHDFQQKNYSIGLSLDKNCIVTTETPYSISTFLHQRIRWIRKSHKIESLISFWMGVLGFIYHIGFLVCIFTFPPIETALITVFVKILLDGIVFFPYLRKLERTVTYRNIPIFSLTYPIYAISIIIISTLKTPTWKNRKS
jgi:biofilm PGA synthesis N-glycosyltransferase PgaC